MNKKQVTTERKFLHDISTPMTVIRSMTKLMLQELIGERVAPSEEKQIQRLNGVIKSIQQLEELHANHKVFLSEEESKKEERSA